MNRLRATNSVPFAGRDIAPTTGTPQYATNGNPVGPVPPTIWPAYAWNMMQDEILAVIVAAGLTPDDTNWAQLLQAILALPGKNFQKFTSSGTWTVPTGVTRAWVRVWGGGGGSGGTWGAATSGSQGAAGGYAESLLTGLVPGATQAITVGTGGAAGTLAASPGPGGSGTTSSFAALLSATGGGGGIASASGAANTVPTGGNGVGGNILNILGGGGSCGFALGGGSMFGAQGGAAPLGGPSTGGGASSVSSGGGPGLFPGGGAGGSVNQQTGFVGGAGLVIVEW